MWTCTWKHTRGFKRKQSHTNPAVERSLYLSYVCDSVSATHEQTCCRPLEVWGEPSQSPEQPSERLPSQARGAEKDESMKNYANYLQHAGWGRASGMSVNRIYNLFTCARKKGMLRPSEALRTPQGCWKTMRTFTVDILCLFSFFIIWFFGGFSWKGLTLRSLCDPEHIGASQIMLSSDSARTKLTLVRWPDQCWNCSIFKLSSLATSFFLLYSD